MSSTKIEFLVQMTCESCVDAVKKSLNIDGVKSIDVNLEKGSVVVDSTLPVLEVQKKLESTGRKVAIKGYEGSIAAVSILEAGDNKVRGVVRFVQVTSKVCVIDGTIDGLTPGTHNIAIHECGDISQGCQSVGQIYNPESNKTDRTYGNLGKIAAERNGRAAFRFEDDVIKLSDVIGRSFVVYTKMENGLEIRTACGIVARSAGLFENPKTICACDGLTIWDEASRPKNLSNL